MANDSSSYQPDNRTGTGFTNLQRVFMANQGNNLAQNIGQGVQGVASNAQNALQQGQQQFQQAADQNNIDTQANQQFVQNALTNPAALAQGDISQFRNLAAGQYKGPQDIANIGQIQNQLGQAQTLGQQAGSTGGKLGLLQRFVGGPNYNQGEQKLDLMLTGAPGSSQEFSKIRQQTAGLGRQGQQAENTAQGQAAAYGQRAQQFGQNTQNSANAAGQAEQQYLTDKQSTAQQQAGQQYQDYLNSLNQAAQSGQFTQDQANQLGIQNGQALYNTNLGQYVSQGALPTLSGVASADDRAKAVALSKLQGNGGPAYLDLNAAQYDPTKNVNVNQAGLQSQIQQNQQAFQNLMQNRAFSTQPTGQIRTADQLNSWIAQQKAAGQTDQQVADALSANKPGYYSNGDIGHNVASIYNYLQGTDLGAFGVNTNLNNNPIAQAALNEILKGYGATPVSVINPNPTNGNQ